MTTCGCLEGIHWTHIHLTASPGVYIILENKDNYLLRDRAQQRTEHWPFRILTGSGRVFSGSGIWPKYGARFGKTQNILMGFGIWLLPGKRDSPKFGHGMRDFLACLSGIREIITTQVNVLAAKANQPGKCKILIKRANLHLKFISFCRN